MSRLFHRGCKVTLITPSTAKNIYFASDPGTNAVEITDMRVSFSIEKHVKAEPNKCDVKIYNLATRTRALCETKPLTVWIDAGYDGVLRQLFTGDLRYGLSELKKPEWETVMQLGDGDRACRLARMNATYIGGTPVLQIVQDIAKTMNLTLNPTEVARIPGLQTQVRGSRAAQGSSYSELVKLLAPLGVDCSIQSGHLQLLRQQDVVDGEAFVISQDAGMIGTPEFSVPQKEGKPVALKVRTLLYPELIPGRLIQVYSRAINGRFFRIQRIHHRGDTHGKDWFSNIEAIPAGASPNG